MHPERQENFKILLILCLIIMIGVSIKEWLGL